MTAQRTIFHVDMDAFFVSVEELFDPSLKGKAVVVGGRPNERGVVSAASYEARKFGVHSAMPLRTAAKMCPHAVFVDGHPERYREYSAKVYEVLNRFSPKLEMVSIDEAYVDMTGTERLHGPAMRAAHALHATMKAETQLNCSIGIGDVAADRQDLLRPGETERCALGCAGRRDEIPGSAGCAQDSRRGKGDGEAPTGTGHPQSRRPGVAR